MSIPGLMSIFSGISGVLGRPRSAVGDRVKRTLQSAVVQLSREGVYPADITQVSFHVWTIPFWYRRLVPYRIRRKVKRDDRRLPMWLRPRLQRVAMFRIDHKPPTSITFRKGRGVVGRCIDLNETNPLHVRLDGDAFRRALRQGAEGWKNQPIRVTQNLPFASAEELAERYGQVAAIVLQETSGEAIGCVTIDLPPNVGLSLRGSSGKRVLEIARSTAKHVETHLTRREANA